MLPSSKMTGIFFVIDELSTVFDSTIKEKSLSDGTPHRNNPCKMSEIVLWIQTTSCLQ